MPEISVESARQDLIAAGITGRHRSHSRNKNIDKIHQLLETDDPELTFGLSDVRTFSAAEILDCVAGAVGCSPDIADLTGEEIIDPELTIAGILEAAQRLRDRASAGATLLIATGHPTGMLEHNMHIAEAYRAAGGKILHLREEESLPIGKGGKHVEVRYVAGVACLADWGNLRHTHSPAAMEALLEAEPWPDLVFADHGFAGAAIERGIPTIAVIDINDQALAVAAAQGKDVTLVPMDDNRVPHLYRPSWLLFERVLRGEG